MTSTSKPTPILSRSVSSMKISIRGCSKSARVIKLPLTCSPTLPTTLITVPSMGAISWVSDKACWALCKVSSAWARAEVVCFLIEQCLLVSEFGLTNGRFCRSNRGHLLALPSATCNANCSRQHITFCTGRTAVIGTGNRGIVIGLGNRQLILCRLQTANRSFPLRL